MAERALYFHLLAQEELTACRMTETIFPRASNPAADGYVKYLDSSWQPFEKLGGKRRVTIAKTMKLSTKDVWKHELPEPSYGAAAELMSLIKSYP